MLTLLVPPPPRSFTGTGTGNARRSTFLISTARKASTCSSNCWSGVCTFKPSPHNSENNERRSSGCGNKRSNAPTKLKVCLDNRPFALLTFLPANLRHQGFKLLLVELVQAPHLATFQIARLLSFQQLQLLGLFQLTQLSRLTDTQSLALSGTSVGSPQLSNELGRLFSLNRARLGNQFIQTLSLFFSSSFGWGTHCAARSLTAPRVPTPPVYPAYNLDTFAMFRGWLVR